MDKISKYENN